MNDGASTLDTEVPGAPPNGAEAAAPETDTGWLAFHQRRVLLQLKEPYAPPRYPSYQPEMVDGGGVKATQSLPGTLFVRPSGDGGFMLILRVDAEQEGVFAVIAVDADNILFCTHIVESSPIVRP